MISLLRQADGLSKYQSSVKARWRDIFEKTDKSLKSCADRTVRLNTFGVGRFACRQSCLSPAERSL